MIGKCIQYHLIIERTLVLYFLSDVFIDLFLNNFNLSSSLFISSSELNRQMTLLQANWPIFEIQIPGYVLLRKFQVQGAELYSDRLPLFNLMIKKSIGIARIQQNTQIVEYMWLKHQEELHFKEKSTLKELIFNNFELFLLLMVLCYVLTFYLVAKFYRARNKSCNPLRKESMTSDEFS